MMFTTNVFNRINFVIELLLPIETKGSDKVIYTQLNLILVKL